LVLVGGEEQVYVVEPEGHGDEHWYGTDRVCGEPPMGYERRP